MSFVAIAPAAQLTFSHRTGYSDKPVVDVEVAVADRNGVLRGEAITASFMVDSGADYTVLDERWAPRLGLDLSQCPDASLKGIGGQEVPGKIYYSVLLGLCGVWIVAPVVFQRDPKPNLLGRAKVFDKLNLAFVRDTQRVLLGAAA